MQITVTSELRQMARDIRSVGRQAAFAQVVALTRTAAAMRDAERREIDDVFDRPTPFTRNSVYVRPATLKNPEAVVGLKDDLNSPAGSVAPSTYLSAQIEGGRRRLKRFEIALQKAGAMPPFSFAVPGRFARLDAYGNISRGQIIQILSQLRTGTLAGSTRNLPYRNGTKAVDRKIAAAYRRAGGQYFAVPYRRGRLEAGIYQRRDFALGSAAPRAVLRFVDNASYEARFDFFYVAERAAEGYSAALDAALAQYAGQAGG